MIVFVMALQEIFSDLGTRIVELRNQRGWTQKELARRAGMRAPRLSTLESGSKRPNLNEFARLADALEVSLDELRSSEEAARAALRWIVGDLDTIRGRLAELHACFSVPPEETAMLAGEVAMDFLTEVRSVIECVLNDSLQPAIRDLAAAASYQPRRKGGA